MTRWYFGDRRKSSLGVKRWNIRGGSGSRVDVLKALFLWMEMEQSVLSLLTYMQVFPNIAFWMCTTLRSHTHAYRIFFCAGFKADLMT